MENSHFSQILATSNQCLWRICFNFDTSIVKCIFWNMKMSYMDLCPQKREFDLKFPFYFGSRELGKC